MRLTPPPNFGEDPTTEEAFAAHSGLMPAPRAAEAEHPQRALGTAEQREWTTLPTVTVSSAENRTLTKFCAQASVGVGPPAVDSSEVLRALVRTMRGSEELRCWVQAELSRSRSASKRGGGLVDGAGPAPIERAVTEGRPRARDGGGAVAPRAPQSPSCALSPADQHLSRVSVASGAERAGQPSGRTSRIGTDWAVGVRVLLAATVTAGELDTVNTVEEVFDVFLPDRAGP